MNNKRIKIMLILFWAFMIIGINKKVFAAISISPQNCFEGDSFTVTISNVNGKVNISSSSNISLNTSGEIFIRGSLTINGTAKSGEKGTVTISYEDATTTGIDAVELSGSESKNITINKKEEPKEENLATNVTPVELPKTEIQIEKPKNDTAINNNSAPVNKTTTNKPKTTTVTNQEKKQVENLYEEDQGTISEFGITSLYVFGIDENGERKEIEITPKFDINTSEYTCNVSSNIKKIELEKEANEYSNLVKIEGIDKDLVSGENIITISMNDNNGQEKIYKIKVTKEEQAVKVSANNDIDIDEIINDAKKVEKIEGRTEVKVSLSKVFLSIAIVAIIGTTICILIYRYDKQMLYNRNHIK